MASKPKYRPIKGKERSADEYRAIQEEIDKLQSFRSKLGVSKSQHKAKTTSTRSYRKNTKPEVREQIYDVYRYARE